MHRRPRKTRNFTTRLEPSKLLFYGSGKESFTTSLLPARRSVTPSFIGLVGSSLGIVWSRKNPVKLMSCEQGWVKRRFLTLKAAQLRAFRWKNCDQSIDEIFQIPTLENVIFKLSLAFGMPFAWTKIFAANQNFWLCHSSLRKCFQRTRTSASCHRKFNHLSAISRTIPMQKRISQENIYIIVHLKRNIKRVTSPSRSSMYFCICW